MRIRQCVWPLTALGVLASAAVLLAASPIFWVVATQADFLKGEVENLSIDENGRVLLGPTLDRIADPDVPALWAVASAPGGGVYVGSGHEGRVYRIGADGRPAVFFDAEELEVQALAVAPNGTVYAATSPDGKIYRIASDGQASVFFDPPDKYIWALALDPSGTLYAATGEKGVIYRIAPDGQGQAFYTTKSTNVMALAFDRDGQLLAATESPGRVYRIDRAGKGFVLLESSFKEIHALRVDDKGVIYAAAIGAKAEPERPAGAQATEPPRAEAIPGVSTEITAIAVVDTGTVIGPAAAGRREGTSQPKGAVYRIMPDGLWDIRWSSADDQPYDIAIDPTGALVIGTGGAGKIFRVAGDPITVTLVGRADAQQITRLLLGADGRLTFVTANPGRVFRLSRDRAARGTYVSDVRDAGTIASWGALHWRASGGGRVELFSRSGNTAAPDETWSVWDGPYAQADSEAIRSPKARYLQWKAVLSAGDRPDAQAPVLTSVTAAYLPRNRRPEVTTLTVHPPGVVFQRPFPTSEQIELAGFEATPTDSRPGQPPPAQGQGPAAPTTPMGRRLYQKGLQTFTWTARDEDGDGLQYDVLYRRDDDTEWKVLKRNLWDPIVVWDTTTVPDGTYTVKVVASDAQQNAPATALTGEAESDAFDVDNTPPRIEFLGGPKSGSTSPIRFTVRDDQSPIKRVEYSIDADRWRIVYPKDGIPDSRVEEFELTVEGDAARRGVIVRATDAMNNVATVALGR